MRSSLGASRHRAGAASRLGRSLGEVVSLLDAIVKASVAFVAVKEKIRFEGRQDLQTKVMFALFDLFAEVERDLISERTREGLAKARASGKKLGRPKGRWACHAWTAARTKATQRTVPLACHVSFVPESGPVVCQPFGISPIAFGHDGR
ncbi:MAG: recombinase family protein [Chloroflexi bacterium]|nr:recombinase family protein [Chloroflexota bacterium]